MKKTLSILSIFLFFQSLVFAENKAPVVGAQVFIEPGQSQEDVRGWFQSLEDAGMQVCRIRLHESHINNNGKWDFSLYDYAFDQAQQHGIKVFATLFPNDSKKSVGGEKFPESQKHFAQIATYIDKTVAHYRNHPALSTWVIQNEPGVGGIVPDNEYTRKQYAKWLKTRTAPESAFITNNYDDEQFLLQYETDYLQWISDRIRRIDTSHALHVNNHQIFCNVAEYDFPAWRGFLTTLGASAHPSWHYGYFTRQQYALAMAANCNVIRSGADDLPYWVTELQAGNNLYSGTIPICPTADEITQWLWTSISNGAKGVIFWSLNPRSATGEPGEWALLTLDHKSSDRYEAAREVISAINANEQLFATADRCESPVTVLYNRESLWAEKKMNFDFVRQDEGRAIGAVMKEALGLYQAFTENGIVPAFSEIREFDWDKADYSGQVLVIANQIALPDEYAPKIGNFVALGGKLIVTGLTGFYGTLNVCRACTDFLYKDIFGGTFKEMRYVGDEFQVNMLNPSESLPSHMWEGTLRLTTAQPAAMDGEEVTCARNTFGRGEVLWIPSLVGLGKRRSADLRLAALLKDETAGLDVPARFPDPVDNVLMNTMECQDGFITVIINKKPEAVILPLSIRPGLEPAVLFASADGKVLAGNAVSLASEETLVIKWTK